MMNVSYKMQDSSAWLETFHSPSRINKTKFGVYLALDDDMPCRRMSDFLKDNCTVPISKHRQTTRFKRSCFLTFYINTIYIIYNKHYLQYILLTQNISPTQIKKGFPGMNATFTKKSAVSSLKMFSPNMSYRVCPWKITVGCTTPRKKWNFSQPLVRPGMVSTSLWIATHMYE